MKQYILSSFVSEKGGGNKAAVVFDDNGLNENEMLSIAKKNNFSETAFIDIGKSRENNFCIRYFTPEEEVDICGHAALASFRILLELGHIDGETAFHMTKAGKLQVLIDRDKILMEMKKPENVMQLPAADIIEITDLDESKIIVGRNGLVDVISTGVKDIILEVDGIESLKNMNINKEAMIRLCKEKNLVGMHVVSRETIMKDSDFCCRNFAPAVGIDEESATGTSNASLLYYMMKQTDIFDYNKTYKVEQGYFMNSPSNIYVKADKATGSIYVGGSAVIEKSEEL
jgi:PhzF family phenazine biosynthesis protein